MQRIKVWDPWIRIWHWALACSVGVGWCLGQFRNFNTVEWHIYAGYCTGGLLLFRLIWGFAGPEPVRFSTLFQSLRQLPETVVNLGQRKPGGYPGHNPLGALSTIAMLTALLCQFSTGLFAEEDDLFAQGPLSHLLEAKQVVTLTAFHNYGAPVILVLVIVHLCAIGFYRWWKRENLIMPMITGWKWVKRG